MNSECAKGETHVWHVAPSRGNNWSYVAYCSNGCGTTMTEAETEHMLNSSESDRQQNDWMRSLLLRLDWTLWNQQIMGPWYATGDMDELAFFQKIIEERQALLREKLAADRLKGDTDG